MRRRPILATLAVLGALIGAAFLWRVELAGSVGEAWLEAQLGIPVDLQFERLDIDGTRIAALHVGGPVVIGASGIDAKGIAVAYRWRELLAGRIDAIAVDMLTLSLTVGADGRTDLDILKPLLGAGDDPKARTPLPPRIEFEQVGVRIKSPKGVFAAVGRVSFDGERLESDGHIVDSDAHSYGQWQLTATGFPEAPRFTGDIEVMLDWRSPAWELAQDWRPSAGNVSLRASFAALDPTGADFGLENPITAEVHFGGVAVPDLPHPIDGNLRAKVLPRGDRIVVSEMNLDLSGGALPSLVMNIEGNANLPLSGVGDASAALTVSADAKDTVHAGWSAKAIAAELPLSVTRTGQSVGLSLESAGRIEATQLGDGTGEIGPVDFSMALPAQSNVLQFDHADMTWRARIEGIATLGAKGQAFAQAGWRASNVTAEFPVVLSADPDRLTVDLAAPAIVAIGRIEATQGSGDKDKIGSASLSLAMPTQSNVLQFDLAHNDWRTRIAASAKLAAKGHAFAQAGWRVNDVVADVPIALNADPSHVTIDLTAPAKIALGRVEGPEQSAQLDDLVAILMPGARSASHDMATGALDVELPMHLEARRITLEGERVEAAPMDLEFRFGAGKDGIRWSAKGKGLALAVPDRGWRGSGIDLEAGGDDRGIDFGVKIGALALVPDLGDLALRAKGRLARGRLEARLGLRSAGESGVDLGRASVKVDLAKGQGSADLDLGPLRFDAEGLQPAALAPRLKRTLREVSGSIALKGAIAWQGGEMTSDLRLALEQLSGRAGPIILSNLNGVIEIDRLWPVSTKPDQVIAIEQIVTGLPMQAALFRFELDGTELTVKEGKLGLVGGTAILEPGLISLTRPGQRLFLTIDRLSVAELFKLAGIAGLSGEGEVSGSVPVTLFADGIIIADAILSARGPGVLRYDRAQAPAALVNAGQSVELALSALSDFHYEELIVRLDRKLTGDTVLALHISGDNPNFYEGYPVEFNLTLTGKLDQALRKGLAGYQVPSIIEQRLIELQ